MAKISSNIKKFRTERKLTQDALAEKINVSRQTISSWETNRTQPDIDMLELLSAALEVGVEELIYGKKNNVGLEPEKKKSRNVMVIVLSALGTLLTATGLIIVFASFWEELQFAKNIFALLPLAAGFGLAFYAVTKKRDSIPWREGAAVAWSVGFAVTNALVNSLNNVNMGFAPLLLIDAVLLIPVILIVKGVFPTAAYFYAIAHSCILLVSDGGKSVTVIFILVYVLMYTAGVMYISKKKTDDVRDIIFMWVALLSGGVSATIFINILSQEFGSISEAYIFIVPAAFLVCVYALGHRFSHSSVKPVFAVLCTVWTSVLVFFDIPMNSYEKYSSEWVFDIVLICLLFAVMIGCILSAVKDMKKDRFSLVITVASALQILLGVITSDMKIRIFFAVIPALAIAVSYIIKGITLEKLAPANLGMADAAVVVVGILIISEADIIIKGVAVAAAGIILLIINNRLMKKFSAEKEVMSDD